MEAKLSPPHRFAMVNPGIYRGAYPVLPNFRFLSRLQLKTIVSLTPEPPTTDIISFTEIAGCNSVYFPVLRTAALSDSMLHAMFVQVINVRLTYILISPLMLIFTPYSYAWIVEIIQSLFIVSMDVEYVPSSYCSCAKSNHGILSLHSPNTGDIKSCLNHYLRRVKLRKLRKIWRNSHPKQWKSSYQILHQSKHHNPSFVLYSKSYLYL